MSPTRRLSRVPMSSSHDDSPMRKCSVRSASACASGASAARCCGWLGSLRPAAGARKDRTVAPFSSTAIALRPGTVTEISTAPDHGLKSAASGSASSADAPKPTRACNVSISAVWAFAATAWAIPCIDGEAVCPGSVGNKVCRTSSTAPVRACIQAARSPRLPIGTQACRWVGDRSWARATLLSIFSAAPSQSRTQAEHASSTETRTASRSASVHH